MFTYFPYDYWSDHIDNYNIQIDIAPYINDIICNMSDVSRIIKNPSLMYCHSYYDIENISRIHIVFISDKDLTISHVTDYMLMIKSKQSHVIDIYNIDIFDVEIYDKYKRSNMFIHKYYSKSYITINGVFKSTMPFIKTVTNHAV